MNQEIQIPDEVIDDSIFEEIAVNISEDMEQQHELNQIQSEMVL